MNKNRKGKAKQKLPAGEAMSMVTDNMSGIKSKLSASTGTASMSGVDFAQSMVTDSAEKKNFNTLRDDSVESTINPRESVSRRGSLAAGSFADDPMMISRSLADGGLQAIQDKRDEFIQQLAEAIRGKGGVGRKERRQIQTLQTDLLQRQELVKRAMSKYHDDLAFRRQIEPATRGSTKQVVFGN